MRVLHQDIGFQEVGDRRYSQLPPQCARLGAPGPQSGACQEGALLGLCPRRNSENSQMHSIQVPRDIKLKRNQAKEKAHRVHHFCSSSQRSERTRSD